MPLPPAALEDNRFCTLYEAKLTNFITSKGSSPQQFYAALSARKDDQSIDFFTQILLAVSEFDVFVQLMRETRKAKDQERERERMRDGDRGK